MRIKHYTFSDHGLYLNGQLNHEVDSNYNLSIICCDGALCSNPFDLHIRITDVNEGFTLEPLTVEVSTLEEEVSTFSVCS